jgi:hypothetical protein
MFKLNQIEITSQLQWLEAVLSARLQRLTARSLVSNAPVVDATSVRLADANLWVSYRSMSNVKD